MDSGWNWTPSIKLSLWSLCLIAMMILPFFALISRHDGMSNPASEWYLAAEKGLLIPLNIVFLSCSISDDFPWTISSALSTFPPNASIIAWWPRQTPKIGIFPPNLVIMLIELPASFG